MNKIYLISLFVLVLVFTACSNTGIVQENINEVVDTTETSATTDVEDGRVYCTEESRTNFECKANYEYAPVCSYFDSTVQCIGDACSKTEPNACDACLRPHVEYYIEGVCPLN